MKQILASIGIWAMAFGSVMADERNYSIRMNNIFIGKMNFDHTFAENEFAVHMEAETTGFAKAIILASLEADLRGKGEKYRQYFPEKSVIDIRTPNYQDELVFVYADEAIVEVASELELDPQIDYADYPDAIDPITALSYIARPLPPSDVCAMRVLVNDGEHILRLVLQEGEAQQDGRIKCEGGLERLHGYSEEEKKDVPFYKIIALYAPMSAEEFRLDWLVADTVYGTIEVAYKY